MTSRAAALLGEFWGEVSSQLSFMRYPYVILLYSGTTFERSYGYLIKDS